MKFRQLLVLALLVSLAVVPLLPVPRASAASAYSEKLSVSIAGSDALWSVRLNGVTTNSTALQTAEKGLSISWYNATAVDTADWLSNFQIFGPAGYNLIGLPFIPSQGIFLTVGASNYTAAASAALAFDAYFSAAFYSIGNGTGSFSFFSPLNYDAIAPSTLLALAPSSNSSGFASLITTTSFDSTASQMVTLYGYQNSSGYAHDLIFSSISAAALTSTGQPNILAYYGQIVSDIKASNSSSSSVVQVTTLDAPFHTTDTKATVTPTPSGLGDTYVLSLTPGEVLHSLNLTVASQNVALVATRQVERGVLKTGENLTVTISLEAFTNSSALTGIHVNDDWWESYPFFKLVSGTSNINISSLANKVPTFPSYVLKYTGNVTEQLQVPATVVSYDYLVGTINFTGYSRLNPITLSLGTDQPVVYAYVTPSTGFGNPVGDKQDVQVTVTNVGTGTVTAYSVGGKRETGLPVNASQTVVFPVTSPGILQNNVSVSYTVKYNSSSGQTFTAQTNALTLVFSHASMAIGFPVLTVNASMSAEGTGTNLTLTAKVANEGVGNVTSLSATAPLPAGLACGTTKGNLTCANGVLTIQYKSLRSQASGTSSIQFDVTTPENFVFVPFTYTYISSTYSLSGTSAAVPAPAGVALSKAFTPNAGFTGMTAKASVSARNVGPFGIYNATVKTTTESFGSITGSGNAEQGFNRTLLPGKGLSFSYSLKLESVYGVQTPNPVTASFFFGGQSFETSGAAKNVTIYQPLSASISSSPASPTEGKSFKIEFTVTNPSSANVTNVVLTMPVPTGVSISGVSGATFSDKMISVTLGQLAANSTATATVDAQSSSGISIPFSGTKLTFSFEAQTVSGTTPTTGITIGEDVLTRYTIPVAIAFVALIATLVYVRRKVSVTAPEPQK